MALGLKPYVCRCPGIVPCPKRYHEVAVAYCCDLAARLKIEMEMYCPDHRHLYYVYPSPTSILLGGRK